MFHLAISRPSWLACGTELRPGLPPSLYFARLLEALMSLLSEHAHCSAFDGHTVAFTRDVTIGYVSRRGTLTSGSRFGFSESAGPGAGRGAGTGPSPKATLPAYHDHAGPVTRGYAQAAGYSFGGPAGGPGPGPAGGRARGTAGGPGGVGWGFTVWQGVLRLSVVRPRHRLTRPGPASTPAAPTRTA